MDSRLRSFCVLYKVKPNDTLKTIAWKYRFTNPGPIVSFNAMRLPGAIKSWGGLRKVSPGWASAHSRRNRVKYVLGQDGAVDPSSVPFFEPLQASQISSGTMLWGSAEYEFGDVVSVVDSYPISQPLPTADIPFLLIPWERGAIRRLIALEEQFRLEAERDALQILRDNRDVLKDLQLTLFCCDFIAEVVTLNVKLIDEPMKAAEALKEASEAERYAAKGKALRDVLKERVRTLALKTGEAMKMALEKEIMEKLKPEKLHADLDFWLNHTLGVFTPSFYTQKLVGAYERDPYIFWFGAEGARVEYKNQVVGYARKRIESLDFLIQWARRAMHASFYRHVVRDSAA